MIIVSILQALWLTVLLVALIVHKAQTVVPPTAEVFNPPIAAPATRVTTNVQSLSTAREADVAICV